MQALQRAASFSRRDDGRGGVGGGAGAVLGVAVGLEGPCRCRYRAPDRLRGRVE